MSGSGTVLLVEDNDSDVLLTQIAFRKARLANPLVVVRDGEEAVDYLQWAALHPHDGKSPLPILILLDLRMPKLDGFEVLKWLRSQPFRDRVSVAVLTSTQTEPDIQRARDLGADSYLVKPPNAEEFVHLVQRLKAFWLIVREGQLA